MCLRRARVRRGCLTALRAAPRYGHTVPRRSSASNSSTPPARHRGRRRRRDNLPFDPEGVGVYIENANGSEVVAKFLRGLYEQPAYQYRFVRPRQLTPSELDALHVDALGRRISELPAYEATREGYQVRPISAPDAVLAQRIVDRLTSRAQDLKILSRLFEARWRRRTFGSCLIIVGTEDCFSRAATDVVGAKGPVISADFSKPVREGAEVLWLRTFDARSYRIKETYGEGHPLCGQPRLYEVSDWEWPDLESDYTKGSRVPSTASTRIVHASRVWRDAEPEGWSIFDGLARELARLLSAAKGAEDALVGMAVPVYSIKNLDKKVQRDEAGIKAKVHAYNQAKSLVNALLLQKDEETFEWQKLALTGVSDVINSFGYLMSASTGIPMTLLFGMSPGGFSGGESEERNWHNYVRSVQREMGEGVQFILRLLLAEAGIDPATFSFAVDWNKLVVLTDLESVELRDKWSQYATRVIDAGIVKPSELRTSAYGGEGFSYEVTIDKGRKEEEAQANLGATEATAALELLKAYYDPESSIPAEAARAYLVAVDPSMAAIAEKMIQPRLAPVPVLAPARTTPQPALGAGPATPAEDDPLAPAAPPERAPDVQGNTWRTARELAAELGTTASFVERMAREGQVARRVGTGRHRARQYAQEHVIEALRSVEQPRPADDHKGA
ncbi:MAG: DUF1073 domain-containing protein [Desulfurellales bacterium]|nr:MAG: DUF1073 domain-containing protein [Desulfurellales bacterium]